MHLGYSFTDMSSLHISGHPLLANGTAHCNLKHFQVGK